MKHWKSCRWNTGKVADGLIYLPGYSDSLGRELDVISDQSNRAYTRKDGVLVVPIYSLKN